MGATHEGSTICFTDGTVVHINGKVIGGMFLDAADERCFSQSRARVVAWCEVTEPSSIGVAWGRVICVWQAACCYCFIVMWLVGWLVLFSVQEYFLAYFD